MLVLVSTDGAGGGRRAPSGMTNWPIDWNDRLGQSKDLPLRGASLRRARRPGFTAGITVAGRPARKPLRILPGRRLRPGFGLDVTASLSRS